MSIVKANELDRLSSEVVRDYTDKKRDELEEQYRAYFKSIYEEMKSKATPIPVIEEVPPIKVETQKTENPEIISSAIVEVMADNQKEENKNKILKGSFGLDELADFEQEISSLENELNKAIE